MKILYGAQGTGHGHLVRAGSMVRRLRELGHEVECLISARDPGTLWGLEDLEPFTALRGFTGSAERGRVLLFKSIANLRIGRFFRDVRAFDVSGVDLVVTDYEPVSGWIARHNDLPSVGLGHLYAFRKPLPLPGRTRPAQALVGRFAGIYTPVRHAVGLHWHHFGHANLPPTISPEVRSSDEVDPNKVLVYLPGEDEADIVSALTPQSRHRFVVYRPIAVPRQVDNLFFEPYDRSKFLADLATSGSVLSNASFTLPSEALHLGRRLMVKPIARHPEQYLNSRCLRALGLAHVVHEIGERELGAWLDSDPPRAMNYPDVTDLLARWIDGGDFEQTRDLVERAWRRVDWRPQ